MQGTEAHFWVRLKQEPRIENEMEEGGGGRSTDNEVRVMESTTRFEEHDTLHAVLRTMRFRPRPTKVSRFTRATQA